MSASETVEAPLSLSQYAEAVAVELTERTPTQAVPTLARRLELELHHRHLPKFDVADVLSYDVERREIRELDGQTLARLVAAAGELESAYSDPVPSGVTHGD